MRQKTRAAVKSRKRSEQVAAIGSGTNDSAAELSPAQRLGSLGGAARARNLTAEQRREIAQKAAAKRWERFGRPQATPSNSSDRDLTGKTAAGHDDAAALIERNRRLLSQAAAARLRREEVSAQSEVAVGRAMANSKAVVPCSSRVVWRNRQ